jgi:AraC-like DNA-binding protein
MLAGKSFWIERDIPAALNYTQTALTLQPSFFDALMHQGMLLAAAGRVEEALDSLFQAERLNPLAGTINYCIGFIYSLTSEYAKALEYLDKNIRINAQWEAQYMAKIEVLCRLGRFDDAWAIIVMVEHDPNSLLSVAGLKGYYFASQGKRAEAYEQVGILEGDLQAQASENNPIPAFLAAIYLLLGEHERALEYVNYGLTHGATPLLFITIDSLWDGLRDHPRYVNALKNIVFPPDELVGEKSEKKYKKSSLSSQHAKQIEHRLQKFMTAEKPYLNPQLTLSDLAEALDVSTNLLSQLLNEHIGKNFYDYVNAYRLKYFLTLSKDPIYQHFTLLSLAYEAGFNSKTTFNAFFKKSLGTTPSEYIKREERQEWR